MKKQFLLIFRWALCFVVTLNSHAQEIDAVYERIFDAYVNGSFTCNVYTTDDYNVGVWYFPAFTDINNDGKIDALIGKDNGTISYYQNQSDSSNTCWQLITHSLDGIDVGSYAAPTFADLNADGKMDLIIGCGLGGNVYYYRNTGTLFEPAYTLMENTLAGIDAIDNSHPALGDVDNNGTLDLVVGGGYGNLYYCRNIGTPFIPVWDTTIVMLKQNGSSANIDVGYKAAPVFFDHNNDGRLDLVVGSDFSRLSLYQNVLNSSGEIIWQYVTNSYAPNLPTPSNYYTTPVFANISGDSDTELLVAISTGDIYTYRDVSEDNSNVWVLDDTNFLFPIDFNFNQFSAGYQSYYPAFVDIDSSGTQDLFLGGYEGRILFFRNLGSSDNPDWHYESNFYANIDVGYNAVPVFTDVDNDGDFDLFIGNQAGDIYFYRNEGSSVEPNWVLVPNFLTIPFAYAKPTFEDIDSDGFPDLFVVSNSNGILFFKNTISGFEFVTSSYADITTNRQVLFKDYDGDGLSDMFIPNYSYLTIRKNIGTDTLAIFSSPQNYFPNSNSYNYAFAKIHDGCDDNLVRVFSSGLEVYQYMGNKPAITPLEEDYLCIDAGLQQLSALPTGGTWTGEVTSTGILDPSEGTGTYYAIYNYQDNWGCVQYDTLVAFVASPAAINILTPDTTFCDNNSLSTFLLFATPPGGTWSGNSPNIKANGNIFPVEPGFYECIYTHTNSSGCTASDTVNIEIVPMPSVSILTTDTVFCFDDNIDTFVLQAFPVGGTWSGNSSSIQANGIISPLEPGIYNCTYTYTTSVCSVSDVVTIEVTACTGMEEMVLTNDCYLTAFPNPVNDILYLQHSCTTNTMYTLYDITGLKVLTGNLNTSTHPISLIHLATGVYFLKIGYKTLRIIKI